MQSLIRGIGEERILLDFLSERGAVQKIRMEVLNMTIKEIFEHSQNVDGWILGIDGYASKVDLGNPAILVGIGKYRVKTIYPDVHDGKVVVELDVETSIVTD